MNIITRVPSAYFVHLPANGAYSGKWINLAIVEVIDMTEEGLNLTFNSGNKLTVRGDRAKYLLKELTDSFLKDL